MKGRKTHKISHNVKRCWFRRWEDECVVGVCLMADVGERNLLTTHTHMRIDIEMKDKKINSCTKLTLGGFLGRRFGSGLGTRLAGCCRFVGFGSCGLLHFDLMVRQVTVNDE